MLLHHFFDIISTTQSTRESSSGQEVIDYIVSLEIHPSHPIFAGHFPGNPVVPGVCQIRMITEILSAIEGEECLLREADQVKFLSMINPNEHPILTANITLHLDSASLPRVSASICDKEIVFFKYKAVYAKNCTGKSSLI